jgi:hypothetical protein
MTQDPILDLVMILGVAFIFIWPSVVGKMIERDLGKRK